MNPTPLLALRSLIRRPPAAGWKLAAIGAVAAIAALAGCAGVDPGAGADGTRVVPGLRGYPFAASRTVSQEDFGLRIDDDFAWLENAADPVTRSWLAAELRYGRRYLEAMPARPALRQRVQELLGSTANAYSGIVERGGLVFALKATGSQPRPLLVALKSADDPASERVVFDPNQADPDGALAIEFFRPSPDGRKVAIATSGADAAGATLRIVDVASGRDLPDQLPRVATAAAGGDVAWSVGGAGLFCTQARPGADGRATMQVVWHRSGDAATAPDRVELGAGLPRLARVRLESTRDGRSVLALVENGRGGDVSLYLKTANAAGEGNWRRLATEVDGVRDAQFGDDDALWVRSVANAPRGKMLRLPLPLSETKAIAWEKLPAVAVPVEGALQRFALAGGTLYLAEGQTGPTRLRAIEVRSRRASLVALPPGTAVAALSRVGRADMLAQVVGALEPPLWLHVGGGRVKRSALVTTVDASFSDSETVREFATSRDGTPVPVDILRRRGTRLDGRNPVLLVPAGALGSGLTPDFDVLRRVWLDRGGVIAAATLRGAPDSGETWRLDGLRARKQNAVDDLVAAADLLVRRGYTQASLLALRGRGDGALAVAATVVQHPELARAAVLANGRYDLLRLARDPAGDYDAPEFGSPAERAEFESLAALSPYRGVRDGVHYPALLLLAGERDGRVDPGQSRKMVARLQQADPSGRPILLAADLASGQAAQARLADAIEQASDEMGFLLNEVMAAQ